MKKITIEGSFYETSQQKGQQCKMEIKSFDFDYSV